MAELARLYLSELGAAGELVELDAEQARHATRVLRLGPGDRVELFDGAGRVASAVIEARGCRIEAVEVHERPRPRVTLASAMPKGPRAEDMVDHLAQLGVDRLVMLRTQRSVVHPRPGKLDRLRRRAIEAAKQSRRAWVMAVEPVRDLREVLAEPAEVRLIASTVGAGAAGGALPALGAAASVLVLIGPEGGWTDEELSAARQAGFEAVSLGPHVMRIETAAVAAAAIVGYVGRGRGQPRRREGHEGSTKQGE